MSRAAIIVAIVLSISVHLSAQQLVIHEWGTFTALQDETGRALGAINEDVEPLPPFIINFIPGNDGPKGVPLSMSPSVILRLETPVVYFHLPAGSPPRKIDFSATFQGGVISQWYPAAENNIPPRSLTGLSEKTRNTLSWTGLTVGATAAHPQTDSHVWLAPRQVEAADVTAANGQGERYLFYRGVGALNAPLKVVRDGKTLRAGWQLDPALQTAPDMRIDQLWYVDIRADGQCAYRTMEKGIAQTPEKFEASEYGSDRLDQLRAEMKVRLVAAGLFDDEAAAMLNTWEQAYFKSPGTRVFFMVPRSWTDHYLPIKVSEPAKIERVMVGRIDLVTQRQRELIRRYRQLDSTSAEARATIKEVGRFATAILLDEVARTSRVTVMP